jgi:DNA-directed RNA polymerase specialized sigma24 family protein
VRHPSSEDPAELVIAWEAVEELLGCVPEGQSKHVLRLLAGGLSAEEIAARMQLPEHEVAALAARGRMRVLTAELGRSTR